METKPIGIRIPVEEFKEITKRAQYRGWTFNKWINWAILQGLRSHKKKRRE